VEELFLPPIACKGKGKSHPITGHPGPRGGVELLHVHGVNDVRQTAVHTAELLLPGPSASEVELAIEKLTSNKSPGIDQIPAELINP
jgi:hypothetical protein